MILEPTIERRESWGDTLFTLTRTQRAAFGQYVRAMVDCVTEDASLARIEDAITAHRTMLAILRVGQCERVTRLAKRIVQRRAATIQRHGR